MENIESCVDICYYCTYINNCFHYYEPVFRNGDVINVNIISTYNKTLSNINKRCLIGTDKKTCIFCLM